MDREDREEEVKKAERKTEREKKRKEKEDAEAAIIWTECLHCDKQFKKKHPKGGCDHSICGNECKDKAKRQRRDQEQAAE